MNIKILVAMHKEYQKPDDGIYVPIQVGKSNATFNLGIIADNTGDNISIKNPNYCELTAVYWAWKNLDADYIGLTHYRRHFAPIVFGSKWDRLLSRGIAEKIMSETDVILPQKRKYYIESNYSHYIHAHKKIDIEIMSKIIERDYPDYVSSYNSFMKRTQAHMFNMFIMKKDKFDEYCSWLFELLFKIENELDISDYSAFDARVFGRLSELLINVWIDKNEISYEEVPFLFMEKQNWFYKGSLFLLRKLRIIRKK